MTTISDIKLIRTDTTLDLSQKAEKGCQTNLGRTWARSEVAYPARGPYGTLSRQGCVASFSTDLPIDGFFFRLQKFTTGERFDRLTRFPRGP